MQLSAGTLQLPPGKLTALLDSQKIKGGRFVAEMGHKNGRRIKGEMKGSEN